MGIYSTAGKREFLIVHKQWTGKERGEGGTWPWSTLTEESHPAVTSPWWPALWLGFSFVCCHLFVLCFVFSPFSIQPVQLTHFLLSRMFFTVSMCSTEWKLLPTPRAYTFLLRAFYKSLRNCAVGHLSISVFKSTSGFASVTFHGRGHLSPQQFTKENSLSHVRQSAAFPFKMVFTQRLLSLLCCWSQCGVVWHWGWTLGMTQAQDQLHLSSSQPPRRMVQFLLKSNLQIWNCKAQLALKCLLQFLSTPMTRRGQATLSLRFERVFLIYSWQTFPRSLGNNSMASQRFQEKNEKLKISSFATIYI